MEINKKTSRLWVNVIGIPILLSCIYFGDTEIFPLYSFFIYTVMFFSMIEWLDLLKIKSIRLRLVNLITISLIFYFLLFTDMVAILTVIMAYSLIISIFHTLVLTDKPLLQISSSVFGVLWIGVFIGSMVMIRQLDIGFELTLMMFLSVWTCDTFAFIFGSKFGQKKILPRVSPNKTFLGSVFGFLGSFLIPIIFLFASPVNGFEIIDYFICGFIFGIFSQLGDLFESLLKREANIKDTSNILHGHGGVLDRFDSLSFVSPAIVIFLILKDYLIS